MSGSGIDGETRARFRAAVVPEARRPPQEEGEALLAALRARFGEGFLGALYYGSCRRQAQVEGLVDLHVLVDELPRALGPVASRLCALLPPNVYYLETAHAGGTVRCKYAVLSLAQLTRVCQRRAFHSYFWARYAQPCSVVGLEDPALRRRLEEHLVDALATFFSRVLPGSDADDPEALWEAGLARCYGAELRPEGGGRGRTLIEAAPTYFRTTGAAALAARDAVLARNGPRGDRLAWSVRIAWGKVVSLLRLLKALYTFDGGLDYAAWKLERHTGRPVTIPDRVRRRPLLHLWPFLLRLWREGALR
ncbi:MAG: hypothetical protein V2J02_07175 [Pseudomonadales bacterium]|nr:hypothetical protein [Pseudomonadales bacterium]